MASGLQRVCFVSVEAYATLKPGCQDMAGGSGFQVVVLGRSLRDRGFEVSYVVGDFGQPFHEDVAGFATYRASQVAGGHNPARALANLIRLFRAMRAADADVYVLRSLPNLVPFILVFAKMLGGRFAFMVASHPHVVPEQLPGLGSILRRLYVWSLRRADLVTVQTREQARLLDEHVGVTGFLVPNGIELPEPPRPPEVASHDFVWVGSIKPVKSPARLLEIARRLPHRSFLVAGGPGEDRQYHAEWAAVLAAQRNITFLGFVPPHQVADVYRNGRLYLMTSVFEGFPNSCLHAWSHAIPVASLDVDPDGVIATEGLGVVNAQVPDLVAAIEELLGDGERYAAMRTRCRAYVAQHHAVTSLGDAFQRALKAGCS
jgi:glycosyltransferase involved in cell wall biosynthesis